MHFFNAWIHYISSVIKQEMGFAFFISHIDVLKSHDLQVGAAQVELSGMKMPERNFPFTAYTWSPSFEALVKIAPCTTTPSRL